MADKSAEKIETMEWQDAADGARSALRILKAFEKADRIIATARAAESERAKIQEECDRLNKKLFTLQETFDKESLEAKSKFLKQRADDEKAHQALVEAIAEKRAMHAKLVERIDADTNEHARATQERKAEIERLDAQKTDLQRWLQSRNEQIDKVAVQSA